MRDRQRAGGWPEHAQVGHLRVFSSSCLSRILYKRKKGGLPSREPHSNLALGPRSRGAIEAALAPLARGLGCVYLLPMSKQGEC